MTLPAYERRSRPVHPGCVVFEYHRKFNPAGAEEVGRLCRAGELACVPDKRNLSQILSDTLAPIRERRERWARDPDAVRDVIADGNRRAREVATATLEQVRAAMGLKRGAEVRT